MKVVHLNKDKDGHDSLGEQIHRLKNAIRENPANEKPYDRLMIIYRKQGNYKEELAVINKAIKTFEQLFSKKERPVSSKIQTLSKTLAKSLGLTDTKGKNLYEKGELSRWKKRRELVMKRLSKI